MRCVSSNVCGALIQTSVLVRTAGYIYTFPAPTGYFCLLLVALDYFFVGKLPFGGGGGRLGLVGGVHDGVCLEEGSTERHEWCVWRHVCVCGVFHYIIFRRARA